MSSAKRDNVKDCKPQMRYLHPRFVTEALYPGRCEFYFSVLTSLKMSTDLEYGLQSCMRWLTEEIVPEEVINSCAYGMMAGAQKYDPWNFLKGFDTSDVLDSLERHLIKWRLNPTSTDADATEWLRKGFPNAPEIYHYGLAACNVNMLYWLLEVDGLTEDRGYVQFMEEKHESE